MECFRLTRDFDWNLNGSYGSAGIGDGEVAFESLSADIAECELNVARGQGDSRGAGELADCFAIYFKYSASGWEIASELEGMEGAVDVASGADALDDLLPEIAALGEVQGASLGRLLRKLLVPDVGAVEGRTFEETEMIQGFVADEGCVAGDKGLCEPCDRIRGFGPELEAGNKRAVTVEDGDLVTAPVVDRGEVQGSKIACGNAYGRKGGCGSRTGDGKAKAGVLSELDVVHDDEAVEEFHERGNAVCSRSEQDAVTESQRDSVALDATLRAEEEVVVHLPGDERLDGVGGHPIQPADAVLAGDLNPADVRDRGDAGGFEQGTQLLLCAYGLC